MNEAEAISSGGRGGRAYGIWIICALNIGYAALIAYDAAKIIRYPDQIWLPVAKILALLYFLFALGVFLGAGLTLFHRRVGRCILITALVGTVFLYAWESAGMTRDLLVLVPHTSNWTGRAWLDITIGLRAFIWLAINYLCLRRASS